MTDKIIEHMIDFIEEKEKDAQQEKFINESKLKTDVVNAILEELESERVNENK